MTTLPASIPEMVKLAQGEVGVERDGLPGFVTWGAILAALQARHGEPATTAPLLPMTAEAARFDARTEALLAALDAKAIPTFRHFICVAKGLAAAYGVDYRMVSGYRTWDEQEELYHICLNGGAHAVPAGWSWHNFRLAGDFGCFVLIGGKWVYLDGGTPAQQALANQIHTALGALARSLGMEWGGGWSGRSCDPPHFQILMGRSSPNDADRANFQQKGSLL
ncbi:MAG: M15 family metallopeptidase [Verrucomicrobiota bacterium]